MKLPPCIRCLNVSEELKSPVLDVVVCWQEFCVSEDVAVPHDEQRYKLCQSEKYLTALTFCALITWRFCVDIHFGYVCKMENTEFMFSLSNIHTLLSIMLMSYMHYTCRGVAGGWVSGAAESKEWQIGQQKWLLQIKKCEFCA
jgi:hypothetical protein